jgi:hypothetical protein
MAASDAFLGDALDAALRAAGVPIIGVTVGAAADRATWVVQFDASATPAQQATAAATLAAFDLVGFPARLKTAQFLATSRGKDVLATIALIKRAQGIAAWNGLTVPQKVAATLAEADIWTTIRDFIETNI